jgi:outer membrane lipoprotein SlyB
MAVVALLAVIVVQTGVILDDRAQARTAADAAALAGAVEGPDAARELARRNGAELVSYRREGPQVVVVVQVGRARADARASATAVTGSSPAPLPTSPAPSLPAMPLIF